MASIDGMLVRLTLQGDHDAFARLLGRHRPGLLSLALSQVGNMSEAEDLVQEAFIQAYQHLGTLQDAGKFPGWICRITRNLCYAALRNRRATFELLDGLEMSSESMTPDARVEGRELSESIVGAVATLPEKNQSVFLLYLDGWSYRDIATNFDLSTSTVLGRIQRSKRHVREKVSKDADFAASPGPLQIERGYLREEIYKMSEGILKPTALRRRIYGIETEYDLRVESATEKVFQKEDAVAYFFNEIIRRPMHPDVFLENGARLYQERGLLIEYAVPECDGIAQLVRHERAGQRIVESLCERAQRQVQEDGFSARLAIYKKTTDSYGCHDNYLMDCGVSYGEYRPCPVVDDRVAHGQILSQLIPFLVTRQIFAGGGKVKRADRGAYAISQRAEYIHEAISTDSTVRGIVNHRNDHHVDASKYRRLHITVDDANMSEVATYLKVGTTGLIVRMIEDGFVGDDLALRDPIAALKQISADTTCTQKVELTNGKEFSAVEVQQEYLGLAKRYFNQTRADSETKDILAKWEDVLTRLAEDPMQLDREVDWVIKKKLIDAEVANRGLGWDSADVVALDSQYHDI